MWNVDVNKVMIVAITNLSRPIKSASLVFFNLDRFFRSIWFGRNKTSAEERRIFSRYWFEGLTSWSNSDETN